MNVFERWLFALVIGLLVAAWHAAYAALSACPAPAGTRKEGVTCDP